jgi:acyl-CoA synthetase (AMP-forming)/AMP-acid ligase II
VHSAVRPWSGTFADVERPARRLAAGLRERGVGPGDVVAFLLPNWVEAAAVFWAASFLGAVVVPVVHLGVAETVAADWIIAAFGLLAAGGVLVPVNTRLKAAEAGDIIRRSQAKLLLVRKNFLGLDFDFKDGKADIPVIDLTSDFLASGTPTERKVSETTSPTSSTRRARPGGPRA